ncbi:MAG: tetratricopeptide repeat protein [Candidatus Korobacteraceae bacterium]
MKRSTLLAVLVVVVVGIAAVILVQQRRTSDSNSTSGQAALSKSHPSAGYVDSSVCAACHAEIAETYRLTGMGRSFYRPTADNLVEDFKKNNSFYHKPSDRYYTMIARDGKIFQRRHQLGYDGKETNVIEQQVDYIIGSNNHARTYLYGTPDGKLMELPVSWYSEKGGYWAMSPGYDRPIHMGFRRLIAEDCLSCHNGYPRPEETPQTSQAAIPGPDATVFGRLPEGIDCQRCHGPGEAHVNTVSSGGTIEEIRRTITNPARLDRERQMETCMQCHLETTSSPLPHSVRRYEHPPFSYRPGQPLSDYYLEFDHAPGSGRDDKFEIAHQAYRLHKSACFQQSQMTCITCHNPHDIPRGQEAVKFYTAKCQSCHEAPHPSGAPKTTGAPANASCMDCHMPKRRAEDAVHVVMTDHFIQRRRPARDLLAPRTESENFEKGNYRGEVVLYHPEKLPPSPEADLYLAVAQVLQASNMKEGIPRLEQAIQKHKPALPDFYFDLARAYSKEGNIDASIRWSEEALRRDPNHQPSLKELAASLSASGSYARAAETLEKLATLSRPDAFVFTDLGNAYLRQGLVEKAETALKQALTLDPNVPQANNLMGLTAIHKGDTAIAEQSFRAAIRVQPDLAEAHHNLGTLLAGRRDYAQAEHHFEKAVAADPLYVDALQSYGIVLSLRGSNDKAVRALQQAVRLAPGRMQTYLDLGDVLAASGRAGQALDTYRRAVQINPAFYEGHLAMGKLLMQRGRSAEARVALERAAQSPDPAIRQEAFSSMR